MKLIFREILDPDVLKAFVGTEDAPKSRPLLPMVEMHAVEVAKAEGAPPDVHDLVVLGDMEFEVVMRFFYPATNEVVVLIGKRPHDEGDAA